MFAPTRCSDFALDHPPRSSRQKTFLPLATRTVFRPPRLARWTISIAAIALVSALVSGLATAAGGEQHKIYDYSQAILSPDADAVDHNTTRSNRISSAAAPESFELACAMRCEVGGWRIEVAESSTTNDAIVAFRPQDTIYTHGLPLYQPGDTYIADATAADGYFVNHPGAPASPIVGEVYERYGASPFSAEVYTTPLDDGGLSFCEPDPLTGQAPFDFLLDNLELHGSADPANLPLACEDHHGIDSYEVVSGPGEPTRGDSAAACKERGGVWVVSNGIGFCFEHLEGLPERLEPMDEGEDPVLEPPSTGGGGPGSEHLGNLYSINRNTDQSAGNADAPAGDGPDPRDERQSANSVPSRGNGGSLIQLVTLRPEKLERTAASGGGGTGDDIETGYSHVNSRGQTYRGDGPSGPDIGPDIARGEPLRGSITVNIINPKE